MASFYKQKVRRLQKIASLKIAEYLPQVTINQKAALLGKVPKFVTIVRSPTFHGSNLLLVQKIFV